ERPHYSAPTSAGAGTSDRRQWRAPVDLQHERRIRTMRQAASLPLLCLLLAAPCAAQLAWKPERTVELVVVSAPGGGNDKLGRTIQRIWQEHRWLEMVQVVNKVGGGGAVAYNYIYQRVGDAHTLAIARVSLLSNHILGLSPITYTDMTPLAL